MKKWTIIVGMMVIISLGIIHAAGNETDFGEEAPETEGYEIPELEAVVLNVPEVIQENGDYCGPACVKSVVHYLTGSSSTQSVYASSLGTNETGTYIGYMPGVINNAIGYSHYSSFINSPVSFSTWAGNIKTSIDNGYPVIMLIKTNGVTANGGFSYNTNGHFIVIVGYDYHNPSGTIAGFKIMDPHPVYHGLFWRYDLAALYAVNMQHPYKGMVK